MGTIQILKTGITNLDTDALVNAANEGLWEGGGVCGIIFKAAGSKELQAACNAIGGCKTGSAVITPGFNLKSKYIIHAVGPRWIDGKIYSMGGYINGVMVQEVLGIFCHCYFNRGIFAF